MSNSIRNSKEAGVPLSILILEDREADAELMLHELRVAGYDPTWQRVETEDDFRQHLDPSLEIIIADYNLPQFTGLKAIDILAETDLDIPLIIVTGVFEETALECLRRGAVDYLLKDRMRRLGPAVQKALEDKMVRDNNKLALEALRASEQRYRGVAENAVTGLSIVDTEETITYTNPALAKMLGYSTEELLGMSLSEVFGPEEFTTIKTQTENRKQGKHSQYETIMICKDGESRNVIISASPITSKEGEYQGSQAIITDITEHKKSAKALGESEEKLRLMIDNSPIGFSATDLKGNFIDVNPALCLLVGHSKKALLSKHYDHITHPDDRDKNRELYQDLVEGEIEYFDLEKRFIHKNGRVLQVLIRSQLVRNYKGKPLFEFALVENITAQVRAEKLLKALNQAALTVAQALTLNEIFDATGKTFKELDYDCVILTMDESRTRLMTKYTNFSSKVLKVAEKLVDIKQENFSFPIENVDKYNEMISNRKTVYVDNGEEVLRQILPDPIKKFSGQLTRIMKLNKGIIAPLIVDDKVTGGLLVHGDDLIENDRLSIATFAHQVSAAWRKAQLYETAQFEISERKLAESQLLLQGHALESAANAIVITDADGQILWANPAFSSLTGYSLEEALGKNPGFLKSGLHDEMFYKNLWETISTGEIWHGEIINRRNDGEIYTEEMTIAPLLSDEGEISNYVAIKQDITARVRTATEIQQHIKRLDALRIVDQAIMGSFDLDVTLNVILEQLLANMDVDAAAVLSYQADLQTLQFIKGLGFQTASLQYTDLRLGEGYAGEVGLKRNNVFIPDLRQAEGNFSKSPQFSLENFVSYYGVPLISKGKLVGVLEIFHRSTLDPNQEWLSYLRLLASQVAIAIDNITLFNDLQRSNVDLTLAYDATIEGWAHALELKDMETEGHSRRVVELTMSLASKMGISGEKLGHIRRGAHLHDIGKMGIPDAILQKPGKLTDEEWQVMRQHPVHAYEWLSQIDYLQPALEIPYAHHEKWDGTGYPNGLEGEYIPLEARIFAIVDVWDALLSVRPYRKAWSREKVLNHIKEQSGKHFDPRVVDVFLKSIESDL